MAQEKRFENRYFSEKQIWKANRPGGEFGNPHVIAFGIPGEDGKR